MPRLAQRKPTAHLLELLHGAQGRDAHQAGTASIDHYEGQLAVDVAQTKDALVVASTIAGARPEDIHVSISGDVLTIRGTRERQTGIDEKDYFYKECYWGTFSRTIVLPVDVRTDEAKASFENGVLTITVPKESVRREVPIEVVEESR